MKKLNPIQIMLSVIGYLLDFTGSYLMGILVMAGVIEVMTLVSLLLKQA